MTRYPSGALSQLESVEVQLEKARVALYRISNLMRFDHKLSGDYITSTGDRLNIAIDIASNAVHEVGEPKT